MQLSDLTVELDSTWVDGPGVGQVPPDELDLHITGLFNNVGAWQLTLPSEHRLAVYARDGARIRVTLPGPKCLFSGPATSVEYESTPEDPIGTVIIKGVSDDILLGDRIIWPQPSNPDPTTQTNSHFQVFNVPVETALHYPVYYNLGEGAVTDRRDPRVVTFTTDGEVGNLISTKVRFENLGEFLSKTAPLANLGFRLIASDYDDPSALIFDTYEPQDLTGTIRLDAQNNTLSGHKSALAAPGVTHVIVAGQGELTERQFVYASTPTSVADGLKWGRHIERFVDQRQTDDTDEQQQKADEVLAEEGFERFAIQAIPAEHTLGFGIDWNMGDKVTVVLNDLEYTATVTGFNLKADAENGLKLGALIGDPVAFDPNARTGSVIRDTARRVSNLERNSENAHPLPGDVSDFLVSAGGATTISSTTWANVPGGTTLGLSLARDALVRIDFGVWMGVTAGAGSNSSIRVGVAVDSVAPQDVFDGTYGQIAYVSQPAPSILASQKGGGSATGVLAAGSHTFRMQAYKTGTNPTFLSYGVVRVTVLRWV